MNHDPKNFKAGCNLPVMVYFSGPSADVTLFTGLASRMATSLI